MSGTGDGNAGAAQTVEPSPAAAGNLTAGQQQQVMHGTNNIGEETPPRGGANNNNNYGPMASSASPPPLRPGIVTALQKMIDKATTQSVAREFNRQQRLATNYQTPDALAFYEDTCANMNALRVFASMKPNSSIVQVLWGLGKFMDEDAEGDVGSEVLAYAGDRDRFGNTPTMVALPRDNAYKWKEVKGNWEEAEFTQHYGIDANRLATRTPPPEAQEAKMLPRLLYLPFELGIFVSQSPRTPHEVYQEAMRLAGDDGSLITNEHITLVKDWCMGASYRGTENSSTLVLKTAAVNSATEAFVEFKQKKCDFMLGPVKPQAAAPTPQDDMDRRIERMTSTIMSRALEAIPQMATQFQSAQQPNPTGGGSLSHQQSNPLSGMKQLEGAEMYAVMGFCGITDPRYIPSIWRTYYSSATLLTKRGELQDQMNAWSVEYSWAINRRIRFDQQWFRDVASVDLAAGQARATWKLMEKGFSAQCGLPVSNEYIQMMNEIEQAAAETAHTRTITESMKLSKADPRAPPQTLKALLLAVATYAALVYVHFGKYCDLYKKLVTMLETLDSHAVEHARQCYTPRIIKGYWFEVLDKSRVFFFENLRKADFDKPQGPNFPLCSLSSLFPIIVAGNGVNNGMFPQQWDSAPMAKPPSNIFSGGAPKTKSVTFNNPSAGSSEGYGGYTPTKPMSATSGGAAWSYETSFPSAPPDNQAPPSFNDKFSHCHPIVRQEFAEYHKQFGGKLQLQLLLKHSDVIMKDLLGQYSFIENGTNNMCYSYVLGVCNHRGCKRIHPSASSLNSAFVSDLCKQLKKGRDFLVKNPGLGAKRPASNKG